MKMLISVFLFLLNGMYLFCCFSHYCFITYYYYYVILHYIIKGNAAGFHVSFFNNNIIRNRFWPLRWGIIFLWFIPCYHYRNWTVQLMELSSLLLGDNHWFFIKGILCCCLLLLCFIIIIIITILFHSSSSFSNDDEVLK